MLDVVRIEQLQQFIMLFGKSLIVGAEIFYQIPEIQVAGFPKFLRSKRGSIDPAFPVGTIV